MNSLDAIENVLEANPCINTVRFFAFSASTKLQDRASDLDESETSLVEAALSQKVKDGARFWEAVLCAMVERNASNKRLLREVLYHQPNRNYHFVEKSEVRSAVVSHVANCLAFNSKVSLLDGSSRHIPLLDFKLPSKRPNSQLVEDCVSTLGLRGFLLDSGRSYHFIGIELVSESDMLDLLAKFVLLHPVSDKSWAAHQLIERSASLRVSPIGGTVPRVITRI